MANCKPHTAEARAKMSATRFAKWQGKTIHPPEVRLRNTLKMRRWRAANIQKIRDDKRAWAQANPEKVRNQNLITRLGITLGQWQELFNKQNGSCLICTKAGLQLVTDHCHETGRVRGLVCIRCNTSLGTFEWMLKNPDWVKRAEAYVKVGD